MLLGAAKIGKSFEIIITIIIKVDATKLRHEK